MKNNSDNEVKIDIYQDLIKDYLQYNAFKIKDTFLIEGLSDKKKEQLNNFAVIELSFERVSASNQDFDRIFDLSDKTLRTTLLPYLNDLYGVFSESGIKQINRIRSYKGIGDRTLRVEGNFLMREHLFDNNTSILMGMIKVNESNLDHYIENYLANSSTACLIRTKKNIFTNDFLGKFSEYILFHSTISVINYCALCFEVLGPGSFVLRMGGDGGNRYASIQIFCLKTDLNF